MPKDLSLALLKAGSSMAARMAMMAMTTSSSIKVNPRLTIRLAEFLLFFTRFILISDAFKSKFISLYQRLRTH
jgi:hypothetical protein